MEQPSFYYLFCNHWTQGGIGFAFPSGWHNGKKYKKTFSSVYTIHKMLDAADQYPGLKVSMELDAYLYEEVAKEAPDCIERLRKYIAAGKAAVDGGTYGQPLGQDYGWESNIRQLTYGRETIQKIVGIDVKAFLVEEQWFHPQMPQLLKKSGFQYASLQNQNSGQVMPLNEAMIRWRGIDQTGILAIPANDLMVSCVRQYTDYGEYHDKLTDYEVPLLFQWVEIWPPGMDWGASAEPFEKAIAQVREWGGEPVSLSEYFDLESGRREIQDYYIPLDESNYVNNWYQGGGWGFDGDKVIMSDRMAEQALLAYEAGSALCSLKSDAVPREDEIKNLWKRLLILQNHDFSVARNYRAITDDGLITNAGSYGILKYGELIDECKEQLKRLILSGSEPDAEHLTLINYSGVSHKRTVPFEIKKPLHDSFVFLQSEREVPFCVTGKKNGMIQGLMTIDLPSLGATSVRISNGQSRFETKVKTGPDWIEDKQYKVSWVQGSWTMKIENKDTGEAVDFIGFTGPVGKQNEHGGPYPSLSPAHEVFTFAFDGTTHCPDQLSLSRIKASVETTTPLQSTLLLHCDLLTLHTTDTPVAFAEARVTIDHETGKLSCQSYLYTGVYLSVNCRAVFKHDLPNAKYARDFPFGEEQTNINDIYANTYMKVTNGNQGFTLVHPGVQKVDLIRRGDSGEIKHLLARDQVFGDYTWTFGLYFGKHTSAESAKLSKQERALIEPIPEGRLDIDFLDIRDERIVLSSFYKEKDKYMLRMINYSAETVEDVKVNVNERFSDLTVTDFCGNTFEKRADDQTDTTKTAVKLSFQPWEIVTLAMTK